MHLSAVDFFTDHGDTISITLRSVIKTLRLLADFVGMDELRQVTVDLDPLSIAMDDDSTVKSHFPIYISLTVC